MVSHCCVVLWGLFQIVWCVALAYLRRLTANFLTVLLIFFVSLKNVVYKNKPLVLMVFFNQRMVLWDLNGELYQDTVPESQVKIAQDFVTPLWNIFTVNAGSPERKPWRERGRWALCWYRQLTLFHLPELCIHLIAWPPFFSPLLIAIICVH